MNRRGFLKMLGIGAASAAVFPTIALKSVSQPVEIEAVVGEYENYSSFSSFALAQSIDPIVAAAALELGRQASEDINKLYAQVW